MAKKEQAPKNDETILEDVTNEDAAAEEMAAEADVTEEANEEQSVDEAEALREELEAERNKYLRLMADFDNYKRRAVKDRQEAEKFRAQSLLVDLLPVLDNFERALTTGTGSEESSSLLKGVEMVQKSLLEAVKREGLEEIKSVGEQFDPNVHQAVMQEKDDSAEAGSVLMELQKGYTLKGRVLRPAMVKVNE